MTGWSNSVGKKDLQITVDELGKAFAGTGPELSRLVDSGNALVESASDSLPQTISLIEDSQQVLKTQVGQGLGDQVVLARPGGAHRHS